MYSSNRCPAECSVFGETATHVVLKTHLATAFYRTLRRRTIFAIADMYQTESPSSVLQVFRMARLVRATGRHMVIQPQIQP